MSWLTPIVKIPTGGKIRSVGRFDALAYQRAYYHAKRKLNGPQKRTPEQKARRAERHREFYQQNIERMRALARARYWKHRERYAAAARERARRKAA